MTRLIGLSKNVRNILDTTIPCATANDLADRAGHTFANYVDKDPR